MVLSYIRIVCGKKGLPLPVAQGAVHFPCQKNPPQSSIFLISLKYDLWLHSGKYGQADCGKSAV